MSDHEKKESKNHDAFDEFNKKLNDSIEKGKLFSNAGREMTEAGQYIIDLSNSVQSVLQFYKPINYIEDLNSSWDLLNDQLDTALGSIQPISPVVNSTSGSVSVTSSDVFNYENIRTYVPENRINEAEMAIDIINQITNRIADKEQIISLMKKFNLDRAFSGKKSPLELFHTAHNAFEAPVHEYDPVVTSLIPIRESINLMIIHLLKERSTQEPCRNEREKIKSIGRQLKKEPLAESVILSWADQWHTMKNEDLSPSKNKAIPRKEWQYRLNKSTIFIRSILEGLDNNKLRSSR
jgi:hypothetical protein